MNKLIIGFSRPKSGFQPFSWGIRWILKTPYSHVYIAYQSKEIDGWVVFQASGLAVNFIEKMHFQEKEIITNEFNLQISQDAKLKTIKYAFDKVGTPYGIKQIAGILWVLLCKKLGKTVKNPFADGNKSMICSELVEHILEEVMQKKFNINPDLVTPKDIYDIISQTQPRA